MTEKEIAEIRRRFRPDKNNITRIHGCYVNDKREIVAQIEQPLAWVGQEEAERLLALLRKTLSGALDKNLTDLSFSTQQVAGSEEHSLLMSLRDSALNDPAAVEEFYRRVIQSIQMEGHYIILLTYDTYDVPSRPSSGEWGEEEDSSEVYNYLLCSICPVKTAKPALCYDIPENLLRSQKTDWLVSPPETGFLFPAFDGRSSNIYHALYYSRDTRENHPEFAEGMFHIELPVPAAQQKEAFQTLLEDSLEEDCNYDVVQAVHDQLCERMEEHKASHEEEPLRVSKQEVRDILESCGVSETHISSFEANYDSAFGGTAGLIPKNIVDTRQFEICSPDVTIRVNPQRSDLVETRVIDGKKYILIRAEEGVEVNGIDIRMAGD